MFSFLDTEMASLKTTREALFIGHVSGFITDAEFLLLHQENSSDNLDFPYDNYPRFSLQDQSEADCKANFRLEKHHVGRLVDALQIPAIFKCDQGTICEGLEGLCILLKRFAFPCRFSDMIPIFGRPVPELCMINNTVIDWVYNHHRHRIMDWNPNVLSPIQLENYAEAVFNKGAALRNCFGFVDGTVRPISRPDENQRVVYNGHKRVHGLKFQSVVIPNGLIAHLYGPVGELLLCLSDRSSLFFLYLPYKNKYVFKKKLYLYLMKCCLSVMFLDHTTHFLRYTIRLRPSSFFLRLASSDRPKK